MQALKEKLDALKIEIEHAERGYDLNKAAELKYAVMPKLQVERVVLTCRKADVQNVRSAETMYNL